MHVVTVLCDVLIGDLEANEDSLATDWNPSTPTETVFDNANKCRAFALVAGDAISEAKVVQTLIKVFEKSGALADAVKDWKKKTAAEQTIAAIRTHFRVYNWRLIKDSTAASQQGYGTANAA